MSGIAQAASGALALRPPTWRVGAHGIEVEWPLPGLMRLLVAGIGGLALLVGGLTELLYRLDELPFSLFGFLLDPWTLVLLVPLVLALLVFDARSNERCVFGATGVVHETRVGRYVVARQVSPLTAIESIETIEAQPAQDGVAVGWRVRGAPVPFRLGGALPREQAEALAGALRDWIAAPGRALPERAAEVAHEVPRLLIRALAARAAGAIPFAMGAFGLLAAATIWNLRAAGGLEDAAFDAQAPGELVRYRFIATLPADAAARDWLAVDVHAEIGVRWRDGDGAERMLWLRTPDAIPQHSFIDQRVEGLVQHLSLPHIEWSLPAEAAPLFDPSAPAFADLPARATKANARHHEWVQGLDLPIDYATALAIAAAPDWQVAYASEDPGRAQLAVLARIIEDGQRALPPWVAWLFLAGTALARRAVPVQRPRRWPAGLRGNTCLPAGPAAVGTAREPACPTARRGARGIDRGARRAVDGHAASRTGCRDAAAADRRADGTPGRGGGALDPGGQRHRAAAGPVRAGYRRGPPGHGVR